MSSSPPRSQERPDGRVPLRTTRVPDRGILVVRFLQDISGLLMHFHKRGPVYCRGDACPASIHSKTRCEWRGYAAVEMWRESPHDDWCPTVVEVTTHFWGLVQGLAMRGQTWKLFREVNDRGKRQVVGECIDQVEPDSLRPPFKIIPELWRLYGTTDVELGVEPAIPPAELLTPTKGKRPPLPARPRIAEIEPVPDVEAVRKLYTASKNRMESPAPTNGKH